MIRIAQIGFGPWGKNLAKAFSRISSCSFRFIADINKQSLEEAQKSYPHIVKSQNWLDVLSDEIDAVVIATPAESHFKIAKKCLLYGKHVFVEKPVTLDYEKSCELSDLAASRNLILMAGHVFLFHKAIRFMKYKLHLLGNLFQISSSRLNFGKARSDVNVWWNLAPHDISVFLYLTNQMPQYISVYGNAYLQKNIEDFSIAKLWWKNGTTGTIQLSWLDPIKQRNLTLIGSEKTFYFDDLKKEKVQIYNNPAATAKNPLAISRDTYIPVLSEEEPLLLEAQHFIDCIHNKNQKCLTGGEHIKKVSKILTLGNNSIKKNGEKIEIPSDTFQYSSN